MRIWLKKIKSYVGGYVGTGPSSAITWKKEGTPHKNRLKTPLFLQFSDNLHLFDIFYTFDLHVIGK